MNFIYRIYFALPNFARIGVVGKAINKILELLIKRLFDAILPSYFLKTMDRVGHGLNLDERPEKYIVSLTSFPERVDEIWISIECILRQSFKPDKIILWLSAEQFPDRKVPDIIQRQTERGLTVLFCDDDMKSHKKYYYSMMHYPDYHVITLDDDIYYERDVLKNVIKIHERYPKLIVANRVHEIGFDNDNQILKYTSWKHNAITDEPSLLLAQTNGAGVLYPPGSLPKLTFDKDLINRLCPRSDDVWLKMMSVVGKTPIATNNRYNKMFITVGTTHKNSLVLTNTKKGHKDIQIRNVISYFDLKKEDFLLS